MSLTGVIRPYGDTTGDGRVQVSFTLPVPFGDEAERARAEGAALQLAGKMGLDPAMVVHAKGMGPDFTFFIVYGRVSHLVDLSAITVAEREFPVLPAAEVNLRVRSALGKWHASGGSDEQQHWWRRERRARAPAQSRFCIGPGGTPLGRATA